MARPTETDDAYWRAPSLGQQPPDVISDIVSFNVLLDITEVLASLQENGKSLTAPERRVIAQTGQRAVYQAYDGLKTRCHDRLAEIQQSLPSHLRLDDDLDSPWFEQRCSLHVMLSYAQVRLSAAGVRSLRSDRELIFRFATQISIDSPYPDYSKHHEWAARPELRRVAVGAAIRGVDVSWRQARSGQLNHLMWVPLTAFACLLAAHVRCDPSVTSPEQPPDELHEAIEKCLDALTMARRWCAGWGKIRSVQRLMQMTTKAQS